MILIVGYQIQKIFVNRNVIFKEECFSFDPLMTDTYASSPLLSIFKHIDKLVQIDELADAVHNEPTGEDSTLPQSLKEPQKILSTFEVTPLPLKNSLVVLPSTDPTVRELQE